MLRSFGLKSQLYGGFALIAIFVIILGAYNALSARASSGKFTDYRETARESIAFAEIESQINALRTAAFTYRIDEADADPEDVTRANRALIQAVQDAEAFVSNAEADEDLLELLDAAEDYGAAFNEFAERSTELGRIVEEELSARGASLRQQMGSAIEALRAAGETDAAFTVAEARRRLLLARYYVDEAFESDSPADREQARAEVNAAEAQVENLDQDLAGRIGELGGLARGLSEYEDVLTRVLSLHEAAERVATDQVDQIGPRMTSEINELRQGVVDRQNTLGPELSAAFNAQQAFAGIIAVVGAIIALIASFIIARIILTQIGRIIHALASIRSGDLGIEISIDGRKDEIGQLRKAVIDLRDGEQERMRLQAETDAAHAERDARTKATEKAVKIFADKVRAILETLNSRTLDLRNTADQLKSMSETANDRARVSDTAATEAASNVETVAAAAEELSGSIQEIARQTAEASTTVRESAQVAEASRTDIEGLVKQAEQIGDVIDLINDIAEQTNLLALNATIEAARAGEAGKGFAVVANEVKALSAQTAKATDSIADLVKGIQGSVGSSVERIRDVAQMSSRLEETMSAIASAVEQQSAATHEISDTTTKTAESTNQMAGGMREVTESIAAAQTGAGVVTGASDEFNEQAETLTDAVREFFMALRIGPLDRREDEDPNYPGPERRGEGGDLLLSEAEAEAEVEAEAKDAA